jgi:ring-1,2-phenylacetyl-CoA epoxidase subunit PaaD
MQTAAQTALKTPDQTPEKVWELLGKVMDPELPVVSVVELGVVREVALEGERVRVTLTPTFSGCPALRVMQDEIREALAPSFREVVLETKLSPPWSSDWIAESAKEKLRAFGIAPPQPASGELLMLQPPPTPCPRCGSLDTEVKNTFGPTLCKALLYCHRCQEPFEGFKTV